VLRSVSTSGGADFSGHKTPISGVNEELDHDYRPSFRRVEFDDSLTYSMDVSVTGFIGLVAVLSG
jgi:hypothetical protein